MAIIPGTTAPATNQPSYAPAPATPIPRTISPQNPILIPQGQIAFPPTAQSTALPPSSLPVVPVAGISLSDLVDSFGAARDGGSRSHKGIDIFAPAGTPALAAVSGVVVRAGDSGGKAGLRVWIQDEQGNYHFYAHLNAVHVKEGMQVHQGQIIGQVGDTGNAQGTSPHLHYSVNSQSGKETGKWNPYLYLRTGSTIDSQATTTHFAFADPLALDSDDDGPLDPAIPTIDPELLFRNNVVAALSAVSNIMAGGQRTPIDQIVATSQSALASQLDAEADAVTEEQTEEQTNA